VSAADLLEKVARVGSCISVVMKIRSRLQSARTVKPVLKNCAAPDRIIVS